MDDDLTPNIFATKLNLDLKAKQIRHRPLKRGGIRIILRHRR